MLRKELVFVNEKYQDYQDVIAKLSHELLNQGLITDTEQFVSAVNKREEEFSTAIGNEVAIPHGKSDVVVEPFIVFAKIEDPILWSDGEKAIRLVFLLGVKGHDNDALHLKFLSRISRNLMKETFINSLLACQTPEAAFEVLDKINQDLREEDKI